MNEYIRSRISHTNDNIKDEKPVKPFSGHKLSFSQADPPTYREILSRILKDDDSEDGIEWLAINGLLQAEFIDGVFKRRFEDIRPGDLDKHCISASSIRYRTVDGKMNGKIGL